MFKGQYVMVTAIRRLVTLGHTPEKVELANPGWSLSGLPELPVQLVEFEFSTPDKKIPAPAVGAAVKEFAEWVRTAAADGTLDTTKGVAFSGTIIAHIGFALGEATHIFPWAGCFEPRTGGGWVGQAHGAPVRQGDPFFLDLNQAQ